MFLMECLSWPPRAGYRCGAFCRSGGRPPRSSRRPVAPAHDAGHLKPLIDRLASLKPEFLARVTTIIEKIVLLTQDVATAKPTGHSAGGRLVAQVPICYAAKKSTVTVAGAQRWIQIVCGDHGHD